MFVLPDVHDNESQGKLLKREILALDVGGGVNGVGE